MAASVRLAVIAFRFRKAVELFVNQDYDAKLRDYDAKADTITKAATKYGVTMTRTP